MKNVYLEISGADKYNLMAKTNTKTLEEAVNKVVHEYLKPTTIDLDNGFAWDTQFNKLMHNNKEIHLTRIESKLLKLLLDNKGEIVSIEDIHSKVWKGKEMTRFTLRNKIKILRDKTYYELIKNHSNVGYGMN